jgi:peptidoglycan/xylan/chitin deacetylase (PgdA/CDA1 family)
MKALYPAIALLVAVAAGALAWHHVSPANRAAGCHTAMQGPMGGGPEPVAGGPSARPAVAPQDDNLASRSDAGTRVTIPAKYRGQIIRQRVRHFPRQLLALTFDDGPSPTITPRVLKTLREHQAHATFFVLGRSVKKWPELVRQAAEEGHAIGNHSYNHPSGTSASEAASQLERTAALIEQATGQKPRLFRPPYGITKGNLCQTALQQGYTAVLWTISSADSRTIGAATIAHNIIHTPNPGDIVLMHDGETHAATAAALPQILTKLSAAGFEFVTLPELLQAWEQWQEQQAEKPHAQR